VVDKFVAGGVAIVGEILLSMKCNRQEFSMTKLIRSFDVEKRARSKDTC